MKSFVNKLDQFGSPIQLNYKKEQSLKTELGGVLTILSSLLGVVLVYVFAKDLFSRSGPQVTYGKVLRNVSEIYLKDFPIIVMIIDPYGQSIPNIERMVTIGADRFVLDRNDDGSGLNVTVFTNYTFPKCSEQTDNEFVRSAFKQGLNKDAVCANVSDYDKFYNPYGQPGSSFFELYVNKCSNDTREEGNKCLDEATMEGNLQEFYAQVFYPDYYVKPTEYESPESKYVNSYTQRLSLKFFRRNFIRAKNVQIDTDNGWLMPDISSKFIHQIDSVRSEMDVDSQGYPNLKYLLTFESPQLWDIYSRTYIKLQSVLANVGGLLNILSTVCSIACSKISETSFYLEEAKNTVDLKCYDEEEVNLQTNINLNTELTTNAIVIPFKSSETNDLKSSPASNQLLMKPNDKDKLETEVIPGLENLAKFKEFSKKVHNDLGYCDYIKRKLCSTYKDKYEYQFYDAIIDYFKSKLDICTILQLSQNFNTLNYILFGEDQRKGLFSLKVPIEEIVEYYSNLTETKNLEEKTKTADEDGKNEDLEEKEEKLREEHLRIKKSLNLIKETVKIKKIFCTDMN